MNKLDWNCKFICLLVLSTSLAHADAPECKLQSVIPQKTIYFNGSPSYFAKVTPDGKYAAFIRDSSNYLMELGNHPKQIQVPGEYDPVPTPDQEWITVPDAGIHFYDAQKLFEKFKNMQPDEILNPNPPSSLSDKGLSGAYQSAGILPGLENKTYRVLAGSLTVAEYRVEHGSASQEKKLAVSKSATVICGPDQGRYRLPILSKNGSEVSVYDSKDLVSKILKIQEDGSCKEILNLGFPAGKIEFSFDGNSIAFHMDSMDLSSVGNEFYVANKNAVKNIYVYELNRSPDQTSVKSIKRITSNSQPGESSYYPSFSRDGKLMFIHRENDDPGGRFSFRVVDPSQATSMPAMPNIKVCPDCKENEKPTVAMLTLGTLWAKICSQSWDQLTADDRALWTLSLDPKKCKKIVRKRWNSLKASIADDKKLADLKIVTQKMISELTEEDLIAACPRATKAKAKPQIYFEKSRPSPSVRPQRLEGIDVIRSKCLGCHADGGPRPLGKTQEGIDQMIEKVKTLDPRFRMPPGGDLSDEEKDAVIKTAEELRTLLPGAPPSKKNDTEPQDI